MKRLIATLTVALVSACSATDPNTRIAPSEPGHTQSLPPSKAAVVIGLSVSNPTRGILLSQPWSTALGWISIDPTTGRRIGTTMLAARLRCSIFRSCDAATGRSVQYQVYIVDPGTYALGWVGNGGEVAEPTAFTQMAVDRGMIGEWIGSLEAHVQASTPEFKLAAGDVVYVGDLIFDVGTPAWLAWSMQRSDAAARSFLAPTGLAERIVVRPMQRADGSPIGQRDGTGLLHSGLGQGTVTLVPNDPLPGQK